MPDANGYRGPIILICTSNGGRYFSSVFRAYFIKHLVAETVALILF